METTCKRSIEEQKLKFEQHKNSSFKIDNVDYCYYNCDECNVPQQIKLSTFKRKIYSDKPLICRKCQTRKNAVYAHSYLQNRFKNKIEKEFDSVIHINNKWKVQKICKTCRKTFIIGIAPNTNRSDNYICRICMMTNTDFSAQQKKSIANKTGYIGPFITKKQELIVTIKYKKLIKKLRLSYNSDDDIIAGAWLRDDYIRSMDYPHTLNFTDEEHEGMRLKYGYHQKKDWVSKIKGQVV